MNSKQPIQIPAQALEELQMVQGMDFSLSGVEELVDWVNAAARRFLPVTDDADGRVKGGFTVRTLRHYQTLRCLDAPEKEGRVALYRYRHYLQALLIRKLLFEGFSAQQSGEMRANLTDEGLLNLLLKNVQVGEVPARSLMPEQAVAEQTAHVEQAHAEQAAHAEQWTEWVLSPEFTLKVRGAHAALNEPETQALLRRALKALQGRIS